jgi:hypothetical protein
VPWRELRRRTEARPWVQLRIFPTRFPTLLGRTSPHWLPVAFAPRSGAVRVPTARNGPIHPYSVGPPHRTIGPCHAAPYRPHPTRAGATFRHEQSRHRTCGRGDAHDRRKSGRASRRARASVSRRPPPDRAGAAGSALGRRGFEQRSRAGSGRHRVDGLGRRPAAHVILEPCIGTKDTGCVEVSAHAGSSSSS